MSITMLIRSRWDCNNSRWISEWKQKRQSSSNKLCSNISSQEEFGQCNNNHSQERRNKLLQGYLSLLHNLARPLRLSQCSKCRSKHNNALRPIRPMASAWSTCQISIPWWLSKRQLQQRQHQSKQWTTHHSPRQLRPPQVLRPMLVHGKHRIGSKFWDINNNDYCCCVTRPSVSMKTVDVLSLLIVQAWNDYGNILPNARIRNVWFRIAWVRDTYWAITIVVRMCGARCADQCAKLFTGATKNKSRCKHYDSAIKKPSANNKASLWHRLVLPCRVVFQQLLYPTGLQRLPKCSSNPRQNDPQSAPKQYHLVSLIKRVSLVFSGPR